MIKKKDCLLKHSKKEKCRRLWRPNVPSYIAFLLCIVLLLTSLDYIPSMAAETYDFTDGEYQYNIIDEGASKVEIVGQINATGEVTIPDKVTYNGKEYEVTSIGESAFYEAVNITSISIPDSVTSIGNSTFYGCSSLTNITIPDSVTSIGNEAFYFCRSLASITIPDSVTSIGNWTFYECLSLTSITIPDSVTSIGDDAFLRCLGLTSIIIPDSINNIGDEAFYECRSLTSITIPNSVTSIGKGTFYYCDSLTSITIPDSVTNIGDWAFTYCRSLTSITIPDSVNRIGNSTFRECRNLTSITIPDSVTSIGNWAFDNCFSLTSITIPESVTSIEDNAFFNCKRLKSFKITISEDHIGIPTIGRWCFDYCPADRYLIFLTEDGTTKLDATTKPTLEDAVAAYRAVDDGDTSDDLWYSWKINADVTSVTIRVMKDGKPWSDHGKQFALKTDDNPDFITDLIDDVPDGTYKIYDITGAADSTEYVDTRVTVTVDGKDAEAEVNYYTVSFYDVAKEEVSADTRPFQEEIVLKDRSLSAPDKAEEPAKDGHTFDKWVKEDGSAAFGSDQKIKVTEKTDIYASWSPDAYSVTYYIDGEIYPFAEGYHTYTYGTGLTLPIPDQAGYTFDGWYTDDGYTSEKAHSISKTETGDKVYYGRLTENVEPTYPITVNVNKDGTEWENHGRNFILRTDGGDWIREPFAARAGKYSVYDITDNAEGVNTSVTVEVKDAAAEATVNYYTVSFYDVAKEEVSEDTRPYREEIVLKDGSLSAPDKAEEPVKDGYVFDKWVREDGSAAFGSDQKITVTEKTDIYASWIADAEEPFTIRASAGSGGSVFPSGEVKVISGGSQQFAMRPEEGYRIVSVLVDGMEMLGSGQIMDEPGARSVNTESGTKYYTFTNVTSDHTLEVYFEAVPGDDKPDDNEPDDNKPDDNEPDDNQPDDNKPDDNKPDDNKPDDNKPDDNKPDDNKPDDNKPDDNKPNDNEPDDNEPDDNKPDDNEPDDNEPDDNKPGDNEPDDNKPDDNKPDNNEPDDNEPDDSQPDNNEPGDNQPDDNKPDDIKPDDNEPDDNEPDDNKPDDNKPDDNKPDDSKPDDNKPDDNKPDDSKPDNTKPDDNNAQPDVSANTGRQEPQTGDDSHIKIYATVAMIASFTYLLLYFTDEERGMTEQRKKEIVDRLIKWAKKGKLPRRLIAITAIFFLLVYYHGIGKYTAAKLPLTKSAENDTV